MAVTFVLGRAGTGKTHFCLEAAAAALRQDAAERLILLVPEQASFQTERALALRAPGQAYWRAEVLSFSRLARRVCAAPALPSVLDAAARELGLRALFAREPELARGFGAATATAGFYRALGRVIEELASEDVTPGALAQTAAALDDPYVRARVSRLARAYAAYLEWLGPQRADAAGQLRVVRERLGESRFAAGAQVWVDGFAGFTGQELETLVALARSAASVHLTLLADPDRPARAGDPLDLFSRTQRTRTRLERMFGDAGVRIEPPVLLRSARRFTAPALAHLEHAFEAGLPRSAAPASAGSVRILQCASHVEEIRNAARHIRTLVSESGGAVRWGDFAVIARNLEPLANDVLEIFAEYDIPVFIDRRRSMRAHPLGRFVAALFGVLREDFSVAAGARLLRTGLLPLSEREAEFLDILVRKHEVQGAALWQAAQWELERAAATPAAEAPPPENSREQPRSVLRRAPAMPGAPAPGTAANRQLGLFDTPVAGPAPDAPPPYNLPAAAHAGRLETMRALQPLLEMSSGAHKGAAWAAALYAALRQLRVDRRLERWIATAQDEQRWEVAETHRLAWEALVAALDDIHAILANTPLGLAEIADVLTGALRDVSIGLAPPTLDQVLVSAIERSRHPDIKHAWVLAVNEGIFPAQPSEDPLLTDEERRALAQAGLPAPAPQGEDAFAERLLAYIAFTRASASLTISFAETDRAGEALPPSPLIGQLSAALPGLKPESAEPDAAPVTLREAARGYLQVRAAPRANAQPGAARWERLVRQLERHEAAVAFSRLTRGVRYHNDTVPAPSLARLSCRDPLPPDVAWNGTASQVERYLQCPFQFFAQSALQIDGPVAPASLPMEAGRFLHEVMGRVTRAVIDGQLDPGAGEPEWAALTRRTFDQVLAEQPRDLPVRRARTHFLFTSLRERAVEAVLAHAARWKRGDYRPLYAEQDFGPPSQRKPAPNRLPAALVQLSGGETILLRGRIDRVDVADCDGRMLLLPYDYKQHGGKFGSSPYVLGMWLQLLTYVLALQAAHPEHCCAGVLVAPLQADDEVLKDLPPTCGDRETERMRLFRPGGLLNAECLRTLDHASQDKDCPVVYIGQRRANVRDAAGVADLVELARSTIRTAAEGIVGGQVPVSPLVERHKLPCRYCSYQQLCRFERHFNRIRAAETALPQLGAGGTADEEVHDAAD